MKYKSVYFGGSSIDKNLFPRKKCQMCLLAVNYENLVMFVLVDLKLIQSYIRTHEGVCLDQTFGRD